MTKATINFPNSTMANNFATAWSRATLEGHTVSATKEDGSVGVTVYDVDDNKKIFIENYINEINSQS